jgi:DNA (cytosine-5)-methyltransferase 1
VIDPDFTMPQKRVHVPVSRVLARNESYEFRPLKTPTRAAATLKRAATAVKTVGKREPFLLVYYGSDKAGGWQRVSETLRTVTTLDRFALVCNTPTGRKMRMLQVPELKKAMGMPKEFSVGGGTRRTQIRLLGNAVCPPVMQAIVAGLIKGRSHTG